MKHVFIINPTAGRKNRPEEFIAQINKVFENRYEPYEIFITEYSGHAEKIVRNYNNDNEKVRFYAFGGDGTLSEVLCGAYGKNNVEITAFPCGTGNDFVKVRKNTKWSVESVVNGTPVLIDIIKVNDRLCANITNMGFDAKVAYNVSKFKKILGGHLAYYFSVFFTLIGRININARVEINNKLVWDGKCLLCVAANGKVYGGGFNVAPKADITDGELNFVIVKKLGRLKIAGFVDRYKTGEHEQLINEGLMATYSGSSMSIKSDREFSVCFDGEIFKDKECNISIIPKAVNFVFPTQDN